MLEFPQINPIAIELGPIKVHWYGLMYGVGFLGAWLLGLYRAKQPNSGWTAKQVEDLIFYGALGVVLGGRVGYMLFYGLGALAANPLELFKIWNGGMSFHGGLIGVAVACWFVAKKYNTSLFAIGDFVAPLAPIGLGAGRLGNFINGELWGRTTDAAVGMVFPTGGALPRHPSQLYEMALEGIVLFIVMWWFTAKPKPRMAPAGLFLMLYGIFRYIVEWFREPDVHKFNEIMDGWMTMGQLLSLPMVFIGLALIVIAYKKQENR